MEDKIERIIGVCGSKMYRITGYLENDVIDYIRYVKIDEYPEIDPKSNEEIHQINCENHKIDGAQYKALLSDGSVCIEQYYINGEWFQSKEEFLAKIESLKQQTFDETLLEILGEDDD